MQMNKNHADLPKFVHQRDANYKNLVMQLEAFWSNAIDDVRERTIRGICACCTRSCGDNLN